MPSAIRCPRLIFVTCHLRYIFNWLKVRFHPPSKLKIDMLRTSIGSCIRPRRRNISRHLLLRFCCGRRASRGRTDGRSIVFLEFIRFVFLGFTKAARLTPPFVLVEFSKGVPPPGRKRRTSDKRRGCEG